MTESKKSKMSPDEGKKPKGGRSPSGVERVGVVGLGRMGSAFAANLLAAEWRTIVFDRNPSRGEELRAQGAEIAPDLAGLEGCDVVVSSLPNDEVLATVALSPGGLVAIMAQGAVHASTSTVSPDISRRLAEAHAESGQGFVASPVLGNPDLARKRELFVLASGCSDAIEKARPVLERLGQRIFIIGEDPGAASVMKLAANVLTAATLASMGEVFAMVRKCGLDPRLAFEVLTGSLFDGKVHKAYGGKIVAERYEPPGMTATLAVKDLHLALAEAEKRAVPMPFAGFLHSRLITLEAQGWAGLDWSALGLLAAREAGLPDVPPAS